MFLEDVSVWALMSLEGKEIQSRVATAENDLLCIFTEQKRTREQNKLKGN